MAAIALRASHTGHLYDEIVALTLQLEEINCREKTRKAKYPFNNIPDLEVANSNYLSEIEAHLAFLRMSSSPTVLLMLSTRIRKPSLTARFRISRSMTITRWLCI